MRHRLYVHLVWTTRWRAPTIDAAAAELLCRIVRRVAADERARVLEIGIVCTHVHLLVTLHPTTSIPRLLQRFKGATAYIINRNRPTPAERLRWADGYTIASVSPGAVGAVRDYLRRQPEHHPTEAIENWHGAEARHEHLR